MIWISDMLLSDISFTDMEEFLMPYPVRASGPLTRGGLKVLTSIPLNAIPFEKSFA